MRIHDASFVTAAPKPSVFPEPRLPEAAFAGRSNVGKSSLVATLLERNKLVRVSRRPGRTQSVNFFDVTTESGPLGFVDLPGYGYAEAPKALREQWGPLITAYLEHRETLCLVVVLLDARRTPSEQDAMLLEMLAELRRPAVVAATKVDKLSKSKVKPALRNLSEKTGTRVLPFSAKTGQGREELWRVIGRACGIV